MGHVNVLILVICFRLLWIHCINDLELFLVFKSQASTTVLEAPIPPTKVGWKFQSMEYGVQCVATTSIPEKPRCSVVPWDSMKEWGITTLASTPIHPARSTKPTSSVPALKPSWTVVRTRAGRLLRHLIVPITTMLTLSATTMVRWFLEYKLDSSLALPTWINFYA